jgi:hypothetical protein
MQVCNFRGMRRRWGGRSALFLAALCLLSLALSSCDSFDFYGLLSGAGGPGQTGGALAITPVSVVVSVGQACTFTATGGAPPYTFSVVSGSGTIDSGTGVYSAPAIPSSDAIDVTDSAGATAEARAVTVVK